MLVLYVNAIHRGISLFTFVFCGPDASYYNVNVCGVFLPEVRDFLYIAAVRPQPALRTTIIFWLIFW